METFIHFLCENQSTDSHLKGIHMRHFVNLRINFLCVPPGIMNRGMGMPERSPMGSAGDWGMPRSTGSPSVLRPDVNSYSSKGIMVGPGVNRSNSVPGARSMLQQQLMDMGTMVPLNSTSCH